MNTTYPTKFQGGTTMKTLTIFFAATLIILAGCKSNYYSGAYSDDDVYTPASKAYQTNPDNYTPSQNNNQQQDDYYDPNGYSSNSNTQQYTDSTTGNTYITNNYYDDQFVYDDYYDYSYAARIRRFQNPNYGFGYYNNYYTNSYYYNYDPYYYGTSIYSTYNWWGPSITFNYGWGNYPYGYGWGSPYYYGNPYGYYNSWYGGPNYNYYYGYNNGYWNGYNNGYWNGYWNGYNNGYYGNGYYGNGCYSNYYYNTYDNNSNFYYGHHSSNQAGSGYSGKTTFKEQYLAAVTQGSVTGNKLNVTNHIKESKGNNIDGYTTKENISNTKVKDPVYNNATKEIKAVNNSVGKEQQTQQVEKNPVQQTGVERFTKESNTGNVNTQSKELPKQDNHYYSRPKTI